jgi:SAM-dependent methyltransferase
MQHRHTNRAQYFEEQATTTRRYVIPFIEAYMKVGPETRVLEIGCGEGGNLIPFLERGCKEVRGIDLAAWKIHNGELFLTDWAEQQKDPNTPRAQLSCINIYDAKPEEWGQFDLIFARDTLEHIHDQEAFMAFIRSFLKPTGKFFLGFPPWQNPFGGHQQMCESRVLSKLPYFHLLPRRAYAGLMRLFGETEGRIESLLEIEETRITIERFESIARRTRYRILQRNLYTINPNYEVKFGLKPRIAPGILSRLKWVRNFFITTNYYLLERADV